MIANQLDMNCERVWTIITEDLCKNGSEVAKRRAERVACTGVS